MIIPYMDTMIRNSLVFVLIFLASLDSLYSQIKIVPNVGLSWRTPLLKTKSDISKPINSFNGNANYEGFGLDFGIAAEALVFGIEYHPTLRYTTINQYMVNSNPPTLPTGPQKDWVVDHSFDIYLNKKIDIGVGYSIFNTGEGYYEIYFTNPTPNTTLELEDEKTSIQYDSFNVFIRFPIKKIIHTDLRAQFISWLPPDDGSNYLGFNFRVLYKFNCG